MKRFILAAILALAALPLFAAPTLKYEVGPDGQMLVKPAGLTPGTRIKWVQPLQADGGLYLFLGWRDGDTLDAKVFWLPSDSGTPTPNPPNPPTPPVPPKPDPPQPEPPAPVGIVYVVVFEAPQDRQPYQQAVDDYLEEHLQDGETSLYRRYNVKDVTDPKAPQSVQSYAKIIAGKPTPCIVLIGLPTKDDTAGRVLYAGEFPKTVDEAKKLLAKYGAGK